MGERRLSSWIDGFVEYAQVFNTTERYRRWAAYFCISAASKRSIALRAWANFLAPNLYIIMVGGPGTGKSQAVAAVESVLTPATKFSYIPHSVTRAGMEDFMLANLQMRTGPDSRLIASNECIGLCDEMQGILPDQDLGHLTLYNRLFDNPKLHIAVTRSHGEIRLESPFCAILTGAQPAFLSTTLPEQAWGMGFMSRAILIWGIPAPRRSMFTGVNLDFKLQSALIADLRTIHELYGFMRLSPAAQALYDEWWVEAGGQPIPQHKRLAAYNIRREVNMIKLAMVHSLSESGDLVVEERHVAAAIGALLEAESQMTSIFNEMNSVGHSAAMEDILDYVRINTASGRDTDEADIFGMLMQRFQPTQVHAMMENMVKGGALELVSGNNVKGIRRFRLGRRQPQA